MRRLTADQVAFIAMAALAVFCAAVAGNALYSWVDLKANCVEWDYEETEVDQCVETTSAGACTRSEKRSRFELVCYRKKRWFE